MDMRNIGTGPVFYLICKNHWAVIICIKQDKHPVAFFYIAFGCRQQQMLFELIFFVDEPIFSYSNGCRDIDIFARSIPFGQTTKKNWQRLNFTIALHNRYHRRHFAPTPNRSS